MIDINRVLRNVKRGTTITDRQLSVAMIQHVGSKLAEKPALQVSGFLTEIPRRAMWENEAKPVFSRIKSRTRLSDRALCLHLLNTCYEMREPGATAAQAIGAA